MNGQKIYVYVGQRPKYTRTKVGAFAQLVGAFAQQGNNYDFDTLIKGISGKF